MKREEAKKVLGNQPKWALRGMAIALSLEPWLNGEEDWRRAEALRALGYRKAPKRPVRKEA